MGIVRYERASGKVQEMGAYLACTNAYRLAATQLNWLLKAPVNHNTIQRMVWRLGNQIVDGEEAERKRVFETRSWQRSGTN
ncbi:MAG: hypothetical protein AB9891_15420 [Anaerolineaceae bacterium]